MQNLLLNGRISEYQYLAAINFGEETAVRRKGRQQLFVGQCWQIMLRN